jgi:hypothetical protein
VGNTGQPEINGLVLKSVGLPVGALLQFGWGGGGGAGLGEELEPQVSWKIAPTRMQAQQKMRRFAM